VAPCFFFFWCDFFSPHETEGNVVGQPLRSLSRVCLSPPTPPPPFPTPRNLVPSTATTLQTWRLLAGRSRVEDLPGLALQALDVGGGDSGDPQPSPASLPRSPSPRKGPTPVQWTPPVLIMAVRVFQVRGGCVRAWGGGLIGWGLIGLLLLLLVVVVVDHWWYQLSLLLSLDLAIVAPASQYTAYGTVLWVWTLWYNVDAVLFGWLS
jgi:hypothetical protein